MSVIFSRVSTWLGDCQTNNVKQFAPGEARTHGLQIMRLTRCLLRYRGRCNAQEFKNWWISAISILLCVCAELVEILSYRPRKPTKCLANGDTAGMASMQTHKQF